MQTVIEDKDSKELHLSQRFLNPTNILFTLVLVDMFSVSLVVPLLQQYYKNAGITSASQRELLSSLFSTSQIIGGLAIGYLSDTNILSQNQILLTSFLGSAISYGSLGYGNVLGLKTLIFSRILIGLVKQTMTVSMGLLVKFSSREERSRKLGRLNGMVTVAWIIGPSVGALLYKNVHPSAPALLACFLFCVNFVIAVMFLPDSKHTNKNVTNQNENESTTPTESSKQKGISKFSSFTTNIQSCFSSKLLGSVIISNLLFSWVRRATSYQSINSYYETQYNLTPHQRGYLSSYQSILAFISQSLLIQPILRLLGGGYTASSNTNNDSGKEEDRQYSGKGERKAAYIGSMVLCLVALLEIKISLPLFLSIVCPLIATSYAIMDLSLRSLMTQITPKTSINSVLAAMDVLQNAAAVTVPFYRTFLFQYMSEREEDIDTSNKIVGDPNPRWWLLSSGLHWLISALLMFYFLQDKDFEEPPKNNIDKEEQQKKQV